MTLYNDTRSQQLRNVSTLSISHKLLFFVPTVQYTFKQLLTAKGQGIKASFSSLNQGFILFVLKLNCNFAISCSSRTCLLTRPFPCLSDSHCRLWSQTLTAGCGLRLSLQAVVSDSHCRLQAVVTERLTHPVYVYCGHSVSLSTGTTLVSSFVKTHAVCLEIW